MREKYALLDTDFVSKAHMIRKDEENRLIEKLLDLPEYVFCCHEQVKKELLRHNIAGPSVWLMEQISAGRVFCYDDFRILSELADIYGDSAPAIYAQMLKTACDGYRLGYFADNFADIDSLDYTEIGIDAFLTVLEQTCTSLGTDHNLGELKSYVLIQYLRLAKGEQIYVFCSDDRNARNGVLNIGGVRCISVLSLFLRLKKECGFGKEEAAPYIQSYLAFLESSGQTVFRIQNNTEGERIVKIPCSNVLEDIYAGKLVELKNGNLKYL